MFTNSQKTEDQEGLIYKDAKKKWSKEVIKKCSELDTMTSKNFAIMLTGAKNRYRFVDHVSLGFLAASIVLMPVTISRYDKKYKDAGIRFNDIIEDLNKGKITPKEAVSKILNKNTGDTHRSAKYYTLSKITGISLKFPLPTQVRRNEIQAKAIVDIATEYFRQQEHDNNDKTEFTKEITKKAAQPITPKIKKHLPFFTLPPDHGNLTELATSKTWEQMQETRKAIIETQGTSISPTYTR